MDTPTTFTRYTMTCINSARRSEAHLNKKLGTGRNVLRYSFIASCPLVSSAIKWSASDCLLLSSILTAFCCGLTTHLLVSSIQQTSSSREHEPPTQMRVRVRLARLPASVSLFCMHACGQIWKVLVSVFMRIKGVTFKFFWTFYILYSCTIWSKSSQLI